MSKVVSTRLADREAKRLERLAQRLQRSISDTAATLLREKLREEEFPLVEFRPTPYGRHPFVRGTGLAVWEVALVAKGFDMDPDRTAKHLEVSPERVQAALSYAAAFPDEVWPLVEEVESTSYEDLQRVLPRLERITR